MTPEAPLTPGVTVPTGVRGYLRVLGYGPAARPFVAAVVARLPVAMASLGMIVLIEGVRGSYSIAGVITAMFAIGTAAGAPVWGRAMDRFGQPRVLVPIALISSTMLTVLALGVIAGWGTGALIGVSLASGLAFPPMTAAMRASWRVIFPDPVSRRLGYALDASTVELIFVLGPLFLSLLAALTPPQVPLLITSGLMAAGTVAYSCTRAARTRIVHDAPDPRLELSAAAHGRLNARSALTAPGVAALLAVGLCMSVGFGQMDTSMVATAGQVFGSTDKLGFLFAFIAGGSTVGGLVYGSRHWPGDEFRRISLMMCAFAVALVPLPLLLLLDDPPLFVLLPLMFLTGLTIAPSLIMQQNGIDQLTPPHRVTEAQAFLSASLTTGAALGTAIAGFTIDHFGPSGGMAGAIVALVVGAIVCAINLPRWRRHLD